MASAKGRTHHFLVITLSKTIICSLAGFASFIITYALAVFLFLVDWYFIFSIFAQRAGSHKVIFRRAGESIIL